MAMARTIYEMATKKIKPVSRQRRYQIEHIRKGLCYLCSKPSVSGGKCLVHLVKQRERQRARVGSKRRYKSLTYRMEEGAGMISETLSESEASCHD